MVTSADSQIRIICGVDTICKLKKGPSQVSSLSSGYVNDLVSLFVIDLVDILQLQVFEQH